MFYNEGQIYSSLSVKQANVIFRNAKMGNIQVRKFQMEKIYNLANEAQSIYSKDDLELKETLLFDAVKCLFNNNFKEAEEKINQAFQMKLYTKTYLQQNERLHFVH